MRLFRIDDDRFVEYKEQSFAMDNREVLLESWLEKNPDSIIEDSSLLLIGRQVATSLGGYIDLLAVDREGNSVVLELKRDKTPRDVIAQALEYVSFVEKLSYEQVEDILRSYAGDEVASLVDYHRAFFELADSEAVSFNKDQRIVIVGDCISPSIRQTALYLRKKGLNVSCLEFDYFTTSSGERLLSCDTVVGKEPMLPQHVSSGSLPKLTKAKFMESVDEIGRPVFEDLLQTSDNKSLPLHWGTKGFSLNVDLAGKHVAFCYGYNIKCSYGQSLYTAFADIAAKVSDSDVFIDSFRKRMTATNLFQPAGKELKILLKEPLTSAQVTTVVDILIDLAHGVAQLASENAEEAV